MIVTRLVGGLGNQMFQYAVGRALAESRGTTLALDLSDYDISGKYPATRSFELGKLNIPLQIADAKTLGIPHGNRLQRLLKKIFPGKWKILNETHFHFDPEISKSPDQSYLLGYWQSEKYFKAYRNLLLKELTPKAGLSGANLELSKKMAHNLVVSLHIRRGDYVSDAHTEQVHGVMPLDYYYEALKYLKTKTSSFQLFVFSDDPKWVQENLKTEFETFYVTHNQDQSEEDVRLMSLCHHNIIANSSFSWWGAWLNQNPEKIVIAPKTWFRDRSKDTSDVVPPDWIRR